MIRLMAFHPSIDTKNKISSPQPQACMADLRGLAALAPECMTLSDSLHWSRV